MIIFPNGNMSQHCSPTNRVNAQKLLSFRT